MAYLRALDGTFQFDDLATIYNNPMLRDLGGFLAQYLLPEWIAGGRAITDLTFAVDHAIAGFDARQFHLTSVAVHLATVFAALVLARRILVRARVANPDPWALAIAAIWGIHPLLTEAVTYICQRAEVLAALFTVVSVLLLIEADEHARETRGRVAYVGALVAFGIGVGAKMTAVVAPALYALFAVCFGPPVAEKRRAPVSGRCYAARVTLRLAPFLVAVVVVGSKFVLGLRHRPDVGFDIPGLTAGDYFLTQLRVVLVYLRLLFWPAGQSIDWDVPPSTGIDGAVVASAVVVLALVGGSLWMLGRARSARDETAGALRLVVFGIGWYFCTLTPTSTFVPLVDLVVEHRAYLGSWGIVLATTAVAQWGATRFPRFRIGSWAAVVAVVVVVALGVVTHSRNALWRSKVSLWSDAVQKSPNKPRPYINLGQALWERADHAEALQAYERGLALAHGTLHRDTLVIVYENVSAAFGGLGQYERSIEAARKGLELAPGDGLLMNNVAVSYERLGDHRNAESWARRAVALAPGAPAPHVTLGRELLDAGDVGGAVREFQAAESSDPHSADAAMGLAIVYERTGRSSLACAYWARAEKYATFAKQRDTAAARLSALSCGSAPR